MYELIGISIFSFIVYPGLMFSFLLGGMYDWLKRKLEARIQSRRGPPFYQSFADVFKLFFKEQIIPITAYKPYMVIAPLLSLASLLCAVTLIPFGLPSPVGFAGDVIVIAYFLIIPSIALVIAGGSSSSPYGAVGASREVSLLIAEELPFVLAVLAPAIVVKSLSLWEIVNYQIRNTWFLVLNPFAAVVLFICLLAKLALRPFDVSEAEQEIIAGPYVEYGGPLYGVFRLSIFVKWVVFSALFTNLFLGGGDGLPFPWNVLWFLAKMTFVVVLMVIVHTANPRFRIDQAFKWYLTGILGLSLAGLILAVIMV
ncbi:MAG: complex I subunit 1 family protein [Candidatus Bathyarchaeota archaeon]